jgi:hypothetical protein
VENRYGRDAAQKRLGHAHAGTTTIYTSTAVEAIQRIARAVG